MNFLKAMFGNYSKREVKRVQPICDKVLALDDKYAAMSESELKNQTAILKERLANGETTDDILPDAFAVCREASSRVLGMKHYPVQVIGGIVLHQGRIAEMKTGEGKTLVSTCPAYLNALLGKGVFIVTVKPLLLPSPHTSTALQATAFISLPSTTTSLAVTPSGWASSTDISALP